MVLYHSLAPTNNSQTLPWPNRQGTACSQVEVVGSNSHRIALYSCRHLIPAYRTTLDGFNHDFIIANLSDYYCLTIIAIVYTVLVPLRMRPRISPSLISRRDFYCLHNLNIALVNTFAPAVPFQLLYYYKAVSNCSSVYEKKESHVPGVCRYFCKSSSTTFSGAAGGLTHLQVHAAPQNLIFPSTKKVTA